ncbi:MAG: 16S rRNA (uracil(1498)-N(3))-methyltransferase [Bacteroidales bacterium]|jgi:16S rRNA (uracil1498-N3)-methyltransferase|nr:16S rRNA (uracil(1498)-N(3))-methyltransferase [Bacteroidales bacterium]MDD2569787.1 16S rRNA (uracil(1498)-N(3))-methyltransferase [Bacteroidales bacterium]MDD2811942.1 16S rRNA (uracil(1498)-N(3))-methyltransferase [Bacteroidales bacterium]MDD3385514.1 16S rRNA (uracil(1498)-N(3))-methyltransferase [Bacteroidales bacterium]MDD3812573.1 16S rRNA (uracil(1498)-N(3))-methyltransferase [Bacteroidales bacterium]
MTLFYSPELTEQKEFILSRDESHHAIRVLRLEAGSQIILVNGRGGWFPSTITHPDPKGCRVQVDERVEGFGKPSYHLHIAIAPTKQSERFEWFLEKATEIGLSEVTPLICERSERKDIKTERLMRVAIAAMKQSVKAFHPDIHEPTPFGRFIGQAFTGSKAIAHCTDGEKQWLDQVERESRTITLLIGPEGDFSPKEIKEALDHGFTPITLGNSRLRTETAGVVATQTVAWIFR